MAEIRYPQALYGLLYELFLQAMRNGERLHDCGTPVFNNLRFSLRTASP
jgi:hypothetical protein